MKKYISIACFTLMFSLCAYVSFATNYYVNPSSTATSALGTLDAPWKTIAQVNAGTTLLVPGDTVFFKRGESFLGELFCWRSGTYAKPIVYTAYGTGEKPSFTNTKSDVIAMYNRQFVVIDGLKVIDNTMDVNDHSITAKISYAIVVDNSSYCTIKNCDISLVGIGLEVTNGSNNTTITSNYIHNLRIVRNTVGGDDDYGANAMVIGSSSNIIMYNKFESCWAYCYDYGHDGGAIEFFGLNMNENIVEFNTAIECDGFAEVGSNADGTAIDNLFAYNKIINCGPLGVFHNDSGFTVMVYNTNFFNNVIVDNHKLFESVTGLFWFGDNTKADVVFLKNNIVWLTSGVNFVNNNIDTLKMVHEHNIYRMTNGTLGVNLDPSEILLNNTGANSLFMDTSGLPQNWDYHLKANSPAINFGTNVGLTKDFDGNTFVGNPDAGIYEYLNTTPSYLKIMVSADSIHCNGGQTVIHISAVNGVPPYNGVGDFTVSAGTYNYTIRDAVGATSSRTITIGEPNKISISISPVLITNISGTANVTVTASGGVAPYMYSLDNGAFQTSNVFYQVQDGAHTVVVKDGNNCEATFNNTIVDIPVTAVPNDRLQIHVNPNPTYNYFTLSAIKYRNRVYPMGVKVYNLNTGILVYATQTYSDHAVRFGSNFLPGNYVIVVELAGTVQALQLLKL